MLAAVLPLHGRLLADSETGAENAAERAPLILGLRHPDPSVQRAAALAFNRLLDRLRTLDEAPRALRILAGLQQQGLDTRVVHYNRARLALYPGGDSEAALGRGAGDA